MSFCLLHSCSIEYWERFGQTYSEMIEAMSPQPDEVIVASLVPLNVPSFIRNIETKELFWDGCYEAAVACESKWIVPLGIDMIMKPDGLANLDRDCDVISIAGVMSDGRPFKADPQGYERIFDIDWNPMSGMPVIRREIAVRFPPRRTPYADWINWFEFKKAGLRVEFDEQVRFIHVRHPNAISYSPNPKGEADVRVMRDLFKQHEIAPGMDFPPIILE